MVSSIEATPITGTLYLNEAFGPLGTTVSVTSSTNGSIEPNSALFTGGFSLLPLQPSLVFHLGGSLVCSTGNPATNCAPYALTFAASISSETDIFADNVSLSFDAILSPNSAIGIQLLTTIGYFSADPLVNPVLDNIYFADISSGVGVNATPFTAGPLYGNQTLIAGPSLNRTEFAFTMIVSGLSDGQTLDFPNSFTLSILPTADAIPEPATLGLAATAGLLFWALRRRS